MANTYTWKIVGLDCYPNAESQNNVVFNVCYIFQATDGTNIVSSNGSQNLTYVAGSPFTPYANLTEEMVIQWVQSAIGSEKIDSMQSAFDKQLLALSNPSSISPTLPW